MVDANPASAPTPDPQLAVATDPADLARMKAKAAKFGATLMRGVGRRFVAMDDGSLKYGATFYDTPKPFGWSLCRVNVYSIPAKVIDNRQPSEGEGYWADDLEIKTRYAIWTSPAGQRQKDGREYRLCAAYRDFGHTFTDMGDGSAERGAELLDVLLRAARDGGALPFKLVCATVVGATVKDGGCDGRALLRQWSLKQLRQVRDETEGKRDGTATLHLDTLFIATPDPKQDVSISVKSRDVAGMRPTRASDIVSAGIIVEKIPCDC